MFAIRYLAVVLMIHFALDVADASVVVSEKLEKVIPRINVVVRAKVKERQHPVDNNHSRYRYRIEIEEVLMGDFEKRELELRYYEAGNPDVSEITPASLIESRLKPGKSYLFLFTSIKPAGNLGIVLTRAEPLEKRAAVVNLANHNLVTRWVIERVAKTLPKNWRHTKKTGKVAPTHWQDGFGVELVFHREDFSPKDEERGTGGEVCVWVMQQGYGPKSQQEVIKAETGPAEELPTRHGCRVLIWSDGPSKEWPRAIDDIRAALSAKVDNITSRFAMLGLKKGMKREQVEKLVAALHGKRNMYSPYGNNLKGGTVQYRDGGSVLEVEYKPGSPAPTISKPDGTTQGYPPIDESVIAFTIRRTAIPVEPVWSQPKAGLRCRLTLPKTSFHLNDTIPFTLEIQNASDTAVSFQLSRHVESLRVRTRDG
jgi:hypothetical protein